MRWVPFVVLAYLAVLVQTTLGQLLVFQWRSVGAVGPDLLAVVAVFLAMYAPGIDALIAAWALGILVDLTTAGGAGALTRVGPMGISYVLAAYVLVQLREAFFRERLASQFILTLLFCAIAHGLWIVAQSLLAGNWTDTADMLLQAGCVALYTAAVMPLGHWLLRKVLGLLLATVGPRVRRMRR